MTKTLSIARVCVVLFALLAAYGPAPNPREAARLNNIGVAYMNQQLFEKALKSFEAAAAADPTLQVAAVNRGVALLNLQRLSEAKAQLEEAAKQNPKDAHAWYSLGLYYKNSSSPEAAIAAFRRVTELDSNDADTWYFLGSTHAQLKQFPEAIAAFEHALKLDPHHASAQFGLARAYQQSGQSDPAHEAMKKFQYITQKKLGVPISLAYGEQGKYSRAEDSPVAVQQVTPQIAVKFVEVTRTAGLATKPNPVPDKSLASYAGPGACFLDYDGDGNIDIFLSDNGSQGGLSLYRNLGNGKFEDVTKRAGLDPSLHGAGCTAGDYDNDGATDLVVTFYDRIMLLHNEKSGTFKDVTETAGIKSAGNVGVTFIDYDHDGDLDLYVTRALDERPQPSKGYASWSPDLPRARNVMWRNNGNGAFSDVTEALGVNGAAPSVAAVGTDYNNDRAVDIAVTGASQIEGFEHPPFHGASIYENPREGRFLKREMWSTPTPSMTAGIAVLDFDHDGWMDVAFTHWGAPGISLWKNNQGKTFDQVPLPKVDWSRAYGIVALDYDNDGAVDLLITQNHGPAVLLRNEGGNKNNSLRLALKGLNDNKSAIGTKVEVFSDGIRQKFEVYGSSGYLGQNSPYLTIGLGQAKVADVVRLLWPTGVLQDEIEVAANKLQHIQEIDRRGSSCPTLFAWDGHEYRFVGDMLGAGVVGHWIAANQSKVERNIPRPTEAIKLDRAAPRQKDGTLSFRFMEPLEESVYLDQVKLLAVDHPADLDVYPNEYFASNPPYPPFKVVFSKNNDARPPAGAWDEHGHNVLPDLLAHRYFGDFKVLSFMGFTEPHSLELDLGEPYRGGPLWLLLHGEIEYYSATSMYAADQAGLRPFAPYVEALKEPSFLGGAALQRCDKRTVLNPALAAEGKSSKAKGQWVRVIDDVGFPAGAARTMTADLTGKLPVGTRRIRITTNLQIYWDNILISRTSHDNIQNQSARLTPVPLARAELRFHGFPLKIEGQPPGNVNYIYEKASATGPYTRPAGAYTRYGDVRPLLDSLDDKFVVFGSGDEVALDFDPANLPALPRGWVRDYFFVANGYEKDMDFYAYRGNTVDPLPFRDMRAYPYPDQSFPTDAEHMNYLLEYNTRFMSGNEATGYSFHYPK